jgi:hypothetical protein
MHHGGLIVHLEPTVRVHGFARKARQQLPPLTTPRRGPMPGRPVVQGDQQVEALFLPDLADNDARRRIRSASWTRPRRGTSPVPSRLAATLQRDRVRQRNRQVPVADAQVVQVTSSDPRGGVKHHARALIGSLRRRPRPMHIVTSQPAGRPYRRFLAGFRAL